MNSFALFSGLALMFVLVAATPVSRERRQTDEPLTIEEQMGLPSNASAIRPNIVDTFSCENRIYGYYADVDNECQLFHVCYPVAMADGTSQVFKWSFICPEQTIFNQVGQFAFFIRLPVSVFFHSSRCLFLYGARGADVPCVFNAVC